MMSKDKYRVFVIMPFKDEFTYLFDDLKNEFKDEYVFCNAGDMEQVENQRNIIKDIVEGIESADIVLADLTGLNSNVFYELGLSHALNKKTIIITQDIGEIPFDLRSYRAIQYGIKFYEFPEFKEKLANVLKSAIDGSGLFGNPVSDFSRKKQNSINNAELTKELINANGVEGELDSDKKGLLDYYADITENSESMTVELNKMAEDLDDMTRYIDKFTEDVDTINSANRSNSVTLIRIACRKLAIPIDLCGNRMKEHIAVISNNWDSIEKGYLSILDSKTGMDNMNQLKNGVESLKELKIAIFESDSSMQYLYSELEKGLGIENKLTFAINNMMKQVEKFMILTSSMKSSVDRIIVKMDIISQN